MRKIESSEFIFRGKRICSFEKFLCRLVIGNQNSWKFYDLRFWSSSFLVIRCFVKVTLIFTFWKTNVPPLQEYARSHEKIIMYQFFFFYYLTKRYLAPEDPKFQKNLNSNHERIQVGNIEEERFRKIQKIQTRCQIKLCQFWYL